MKKELASEVAHNLLTLEVNTIIKQDMTGEPMPALAHALLDIAEAYAAFLLHCGVNVQDFLEAPSPEDFALRKPSNEERKKGIRKASLTLSVQTFEKLRLAAKKAMAEPQNIPVENHAILKRIRNCCDSIKTILEKATARDFVKDSPNRSNLLQVPGARMIEAKKISWPDFLLIRKIWEMGTEKIVAQTQIDIDGDVITRVSPWVGHSEHEWLLRMHRGGVEVAASSWRHLFEILHKIVGEAINKLL